MSDHPPEDDTLARAVETHRQRRDVWIRGGERSLARNLAMIGALGWLIVVPMLAGMFAGRWIDRTYGQGIFWTASLLFLGLALGCRLAWQRIHHE